MPLGLCHIPSVPRVCRMAACYIPSVPRVCRIAGCHIPSVPRVCHMAACHIPSVPRVCRMAACHFPRPNLEMGIPLCRLVVCHFPPYPCKSYIFWQSFLDLVKWDMMYWKFCCPQFLQAVFLEASQVFGMIDWKCWPLVTPAVWLLASVIGAPLFPNWEGMRFQMTLLFAVV